MHFFDFVSEKLGKIRVLLTKNGTNDFPISRSSDGSVKLGQMGVLLTSIRTYERPFEYNKLSLAIWQKQKELGTTSKPQLKHTSKP